MKQSSKHGTFCCRKRAFDQCKSEFWTAKIKIEPSCHACLLCWGSSDYTSQVLSSHSGTRFDKLPVRFVWLNLEIFGPQIALGIRVIQGFILWSSKKTLKMLHKLSRVVIESSDVAVICSERARCVFHFSYFCIHFLMFLFYCYPEFWNIWSNVNLRISIELGSSIITWDNEKLSLFDDLLQVN